MDQIARELSWQSPGREGGGRRQEGKREKGRGRERREEGGCWRDGRSCFIGRWERKKRDGDKSRGEEREGGDGGRYRKSKTSVLVRSFYLKTRGICRLWSRPYLSLHSHGRSAPVEHRHT